jgi:hypothetical protein
MLRTVYGSKFAPDLSLGGLTGSPSPKYAGADISYKAPEVYGKVLDALLEPYAPAPNQGEIFRGIAQILTEEEAELWLSVPELCSSAVPPKTLENTLRQWMIVDSRSFCLYLKL